MATRKEILEMLSQGEIDVTRATELLNAAHEPAPPTPPAPSVSFVPPVPPKEKRGGQRWLHIHVNDLESGRSRVRVNVPLGLVSMGLKVGARFTDEMDSDVIHSVMDALQHDVTGTLVEVEDVDDNERVHIFVD